MSKAPSTRWCPTPEQLLILEKLFRSGIRTPNAVQIQHITAFLSHYGRIEGKNVFYWFQNHKARERQRLKKRLSRQHVLLLQQPYKQSGCSNPPHVAPTHRLPLLELPPPHPVLPPVPFQIPTPHPCVLHAQVANQELIPAMNPRCKMEALENGQRSVIPEGYGDGEVTTACLRPLVTLDLFPTKSTGMKDECSPSNSKSSSCSTFACVNQI